MLTWAVAACVHVSVRVGERLIPADSELDLVAGPDIINRLHEEREWQ